MVRRAGVPLRPRWGLKNTGLREAGSLGLWVIGYVAVSQVGVVVATQHRQRGRSGRAASGSFAFAIVSLLFQMPYGIIGVALLTALVPRMSRAASRNDVPGVVSDLSLGTRLSAIGLLPVTAALVVLGPDLTVLALRPGQHHRRPTPRPWGPRSRSAPSGCCRSRSRCCSCGSSTR